MNDTGERDETVPVSLICVSCGKTETIHVFRERGLPDRMAWECLDCQTRDIRKERRPKNGSGRPQGMVDAP